MNDAMRNNSICPNLTALLSNNEDGGGRKVTVVPNRQRDGGES